LNYNVVGVDQQFLIWIIM